MKMYEIHEAVFEHCFGQYVESGAQLKFSLRKSNRYERLDHGHWFYGNDDYAAISFWSGSDWKNKTPNIFFGIFKDGRTFLELTATDSNQKLEFMREVLSEQLYDLTPTKKGYRKDYLEHETNFMESLKAFLAFEKNIIDVWIRTQSQKYFNEEQITFNRIGFIEDEDFEKRLKLIFRYKNNFNPKNIRKRIPEHLKSFSYSSNEPKMQIHLGELPPNAQWIFFTGLNGTGKSNILKGIASAIFDNYESGELITDPTFEADISIKRNSRVLSRKTTIDTPRRSRLAKGFAAYGASRLSVMDFPEGTNLNSEEAIRKSSYSYSLFHHDGMLLTIDPAFLRYIDHALLRDFKTGKSTKLSRFLDLILDLLPTIIPNLTDIDVPGVLDVEDLWTIIRYVEQDEEGENLPPVVFKDLSSGSKSMVAMFGDMLIRLFATHPEVDDFSDLTGIVLIDEIDVHLHPKYQRELIETLTGVFPKIQFIVTTHSPIPLLGAPKGSVFFRVNRTNKDGVTVKRLSQLEKQIEHLLPNSILSSPIFDFDLFDSRNDEQIESIEFEDNYDDIRKNAEVDKRLKELNSNILPDNLFKD